jgi:hypothetical protein
MTSTSTITPFPIEVTETSTPTRTGTPVLPDERERPGGPGNVEVAAFLTAVLAAPAMLTAARAWSLRRRKSARP